MRKLVLLMVLCGCDSGPDVLLEDERKLIPDGFSYFNEFDAPRGARVDFGLVDHSSAVYDVLVLSAGEYQHYTEGEPYNAIKEHKRTALVTDSATMPDQGSYVFSVRCRAPAGCAADLTLKVWR